MKEPLAPKLQSRLETTFEHIAGDPGVTNDLLDDAARVLLDWAQDEVSRLVSQTAELDDDEADAALAPKLQSLRQYLRRTAHVCAANVEPAESLREMLSSPAYPMEEKPVAPQSAPPPAESALLSTDNAAPPKKSCTLCNLGVTLSSGFQRLFPKSSHSKGEKP